MQEVQSVINNISFPKSLNEVLQIEIAHGRFNVEDILEDSKAEKEEDAYTEWTMPKWCKNGDIVFFMHAKTARTIITRLKTELRKSAIKYNKSDYEMLNSSLQRGIELHQKYGGKIFAVGKVGRKCFHANPALKNHQGQLDSGCLPIQTCFLP